MIRPILNSFNAGELSPFLGGRTDVAKYSQGCSRLENFLVQPYGNVTKRPGTRYIADVKIHSKKVRLMSFKYSDTQTYILEFGDQYIRFYKDGGQILKNSAPYEITSSYLEAELYELQYIQSADMMYIAHKNHTPVKISRLAHDDWKLETIDFSPPPFRDGNTTETTITPSAVTGNSITLTASAAVFESGHVGGHFRISHVRADNQITGSFNTVDATSSSIKCAGNWNFTTHNTWAGTIRLERSFDKGVSWQIYRTYTSSSDRNMDVDGNEEEENVLYRVKMSAYTSGTCDFEFTVQDYYNDGVVEITGFTSSTVVTAKVKIDLASATATTYWAESAWSAKNGYPATLAFFEERLMFAGSKSQPQTIWGSRTNDWENFTAGDNDTNAISFTIAADKVNAIRWIVPQSALMIGTLDAEWKLIASGSDEALTPSNAALRRQSTFGSASLQALLVNDVVLFIQRQGRKVREFCYNFEKDGYVAPDLTILAEHITGKGILNIAYQQQPDSILWTVRADGQLVGMTYERDQDVVGWHRHITDGFFESVAVIPGTVDDEIWVSVKRTIGGQTKRYIECFASREFETQADCFFVDSGLTYSGAPVSTVSGLGHLEGKTVAVLADGAVHNDCTVTNGQITLNYAASKIHAGLPFNCTLSPMRLDAALQNGTSQGRIKRITKLIFRLFKSMGLKAGTDENNLETISFRNSSDPMGSAPALFTGDKAIKLSSSYSTDGLFMIRQDMPLPLTIICIIPEFEVS